MYITNVISTLFVTSSALHFVLILALHQIQIVTQKALPFGPLFGPLFGPHFGPHLGPILALFHTPFWPDFGPYMRTGSGCATSTQPAK